MLWIEANLCSHNLGVTKNIFFVWCQLIFSCFFWVSSLVYPAYLCLHNLGVTENIFLFGVN
jgi:hypothetical protein